MASKWSTYGHIVGQLFPAQKLAKHIDVDPIESNWKLNCRAFRNIPDPETREKLKYSKF